MPELLNIVDDNDQIIGAESREKIHKDGLLHREVHVYFFTPRGELIFQHRAKDKDTFPDLLDATVGGHVEIGHSYEETAVKETEEETGVKVSISDLTLIGKIDKHYSQDKVTGKTNNVFRAHYAYLYEGNVNSLKIEVGKSLGFEVWPIAKLMNASEDEMTHFIPYVARFARKELIDFINKSNIKI